MMGIPAGVLQGECFERVFANTSKLVKDTLMFSTLFLVLETWLNTVFHN